MENHPEPVFLKDKKILTRKKKLQITLALFILILLGGVAVSYPMLAGISRYFVDPAESEAIQIAAQLEAVKNMPRDFVLVPNAATAITIPAPVEYDQIDLENHQNARVRHTQADLNFFADVSIFQATTIEGTPITEILEQRGVNEEFWQINDEINNLVLIFNEQYPQIPMSTVFPDVVVTGEITPARYGAPELSIYPSVSATTAYLVSEYLVRLYPGQTDYYRALGNEYALRGVALGWYDVDSMVAAQSIVSQYLALYNEQINNSL